LADKFVVNVRSTPIAMQQTAEAHLRFMYFHSRLCPNESPPPSTPQTKGAHTAAKFSPGIDTQPPFSISTPQIEAHEL
jgi:hypothetical protein